MAFVPPSVDDFKGQFPRDFAYAVPSYGATATAVLTAGAVTGITPVTVGRLYGNPPTITIGSPPTGGTLATATATPDGGAINAYTITLGGAGYTSPPSVTVSSNDGDDTDMAKVLDSDIQGAYLDAQFNFNQTLFAEQPLAMFNRAFLYLSAHYMVEKTLAATQGLASQYNWLTTAKNIGEVGAAFGIPKRILDDPMLAYLARTRYGATYLAIISPLLIGNIMVSPRQSLP